METEFLKSVKKKLFSLTTDKEIVEAYVNKYFYNIKLDSKLENKLSLIQI